MLNMEVTCKHLLTLLKQSKAKLTTHKNNKKGNVNKFRHANLLNLLV